MRLLLYLPVLVLIAAVILLMTNHDQEAIYTGATGLILMLIWIIYIIKLLRESVGNDLDRDKF